MMDDIIKFWKEVVLNISAQGKDFSLKKLPVVAFSNIMPKLSSVK